MFATHNAHTVASVLAMAKDARRAFEFQRLHGMGEALHDDQVVACGESRHRAAASMLRSARMPTCLPYLVRRLLENGANSSFVQPASSTSECRSPRRSSRDPFEAVAEQGAASSHIRAIRAARMHIFGSGPREKLSRHGILPDPETLAEMATTLRQAFMAAPLDRKWTAAPISPAGETLSGPGEVRSHNPADNRGRLSGTVREADG